MAALSTLAGAWLLAGIYRDRLGLALAISVSWGVGAGYLTWGLQ